MEEKSSMTTKEMIIDEYNKTTIAHPSYRDIAKKVGVNHTYVFQIIKEYKSKQKEAAK